MSARSIKSPLVGWVLPLGHLPDPVFAQGMAGDGLAIDPTAGVLCAPCDGIVVPMNNARHAVTLRTPEGHEILMHVGIDTVRLQGDGFSLLVEPGRAVFAGEALLRFDLDRIARGAKSLATPILLATPGRIGFRAPAGPIAVGDPLMEILPEAGTADASGAGAGHEQSRRYIVPFDHGLHARPAATLAAQLKPFSARVTVVARGHRANAKSTVAIMALGVRRGEAIEIAVEGAGGDEVAAVFRAIDMVMPPARAAAAAAPPVAAPAESLSGATIKGVVASRGLTLGTAVSLVEPELAVAETGTGEAAESARLDAALAAVHARLTRLGATAEGAQAAVLDAHRTLLSDPELVDAARRAMARGKSAGFAWRAAVRASVAALDASADARMKERAADLSDLERQVQRALAGQAPDSTRELPPRAILLAREVLPSQLMALDASRVAGLCSAEGGPTSHVAIIAAARGIPALVAAGARVLDIAEGTRLKLDAFYGVLTVDPDAQTWTATEAAIEAARRQREADIAAAGEEARTLDGVRIHVMANLGGLEEAGPAVAQGAEGCGLLRTEFLFLDRGEAPTEDEQRALYQGIAERLGERPLTIRTLDIGGDKPIPYLPLPAEDNPALGLRGLRTSLWRPDLLVTQLKAMLGGSAPGTRRILLPMVTDPTDIDEVRRMLDALGPGQPPALGVMIETPSSALLIEQLIDRVDFVSIGTNDLSQYTLAMDRGHPELAARLDALHPAVLRLIARVAEVAHAAGKDAAVCGGLASDTDAVPILVGLGIRELSAVPSAIPVVKRTLRTLDAQRCAVLAREALDLPDAKSVRARVAQWHRGNGPGTISLGGLTP
ncbi:MAG: phosphoenolpyruvate--protein phosphotransferase [Betaproteobacteria bacterium]|nr:phosphoenolpyruvate--protein phosphotransferase [Betaproteobacteria bacterium]